MNYLEGYNACSQLDIHQEHSCSCEGLKTPSHQTPKKNARETTDDST